MGIFSKKKVETQEQMAMPSAFPNGKKLNIPAPPSSKSEKLFSGNEQHKDDFESDFNIDKPISEVKGNTLTPTKLNATEDIGITLPMFSRKEKSKVDLEQIEKELSLSKNVDTKKQFEIPLPESENLKKKEELFPSEETKEELVEEKPIVDLNETESEESLMPEVHLDETVDVEIPEEIDEIPEFIPELELDEEFIEESSPHSDARELVAYIDLISIQEMHKNSEDITERMISLNNSLDKMHDLYRKEMLEFQKTRDLFEDIERKILFVNKTLFSEE